MKDKGAEGTETATETMQCFSLENTGLLLQDEAAPLIPSLPWEVALGDSDPSLFHINMSWTWQLPSEEQICPLMSILGGLTFGQTGMPGVHLLLFVIRELRECLEIKADEGACSHARLICALEHPMWDTLIWESWSGTVTHSQGWRTVPGWQHGLGLICCMDLTSSHSAPWVIISDISKPICWGDEKPIWLNGIKKRLEQRKRAKMMWCNYKKHQVVSRWVFLPLSG